MPLRFISDLAGTLQASFRIGVNKLANVAGVLTSQTNAGADAPIAASEAQIKGASYTTSLRAASSGQAASITFELPPAIGASNQVLADDGTGKLGFLTVDVAENSVKAEDQVITYNNSSPVSIVTLPAGATVQRVLVEVEEAFDATGPSLSVGLVGTTSKYMGTTDLDLAVQATYEVAPMIEEAGSVTPIVTFAPGVAGTVGSARVTVQWALPG